MRNNLKAEQRSLFDAEPVALRQVTGQASLLAEPVALGAPNETPKAKPVASRENEWLGIVDLEVLRPKILSCDGCDLRRSAKGVVFGDGDPAATIMFVGEGPGRTEDETGHPFVGRAGQLLDTMLQSASLKRGQVFIANIVKCRPPENRLPLPAEVQACLPNLRAQMRIVKPRIVVLLGALASQTLVDPAIRVTRDRGKWFHKDEIDYLVTFHPAAVLRDEANKKRLVWEDMRSLQLKWEEIRSGK